MLFDHAGVVRVIYSVGAEEKLASSNDAQMHNQLLITALHLIPLSLMILGALQDLRRVSIEELKKVESSLDKESSEDAEMRDKYGSRWNRPASAALNSSMREKIAGYNANLTAAGDSDARLEQRLMQNNAAFSALSIDAAVSQMPRLQVRLHQPLLLIALSVGLASLLGRTLHTCLCSTGVGLTFIPSLLNKQRHDNTGQEMFASAHTLFAWEV